MGDQFAAYRRVRGDRHAGDKPVHFPKGSEYIWEWFLGCCSARTGSGFGPNPLAHSEIVAWVTAAGYGPLEPWEFDTIRRIDGEYMRSQREMAEGRDKKSRQHAGRRGRR